MKKYALIGIGTDSSRAVDSFHYNNINIDKIAIDDNDDSLNSLQNSRAIRVSIGKENENYKLNNKDKEKILDLIKEYDTVCFLVCLWADRYKGADIIKKIIKTHNDNYFVIIQTPLSFMGEKLNTYAQETINYLKKITKNVFVIDSKETLERTFAFKSEDMQMQNINGKIWRMHKTEFMKNFENKYGKRGI